MSGGFDWSKADEYLKRSAAGSAAKIAGDRMEQDLLEQAGYMRDTLLIKQYPETKFFGRGNAKVIDKGWPDFILLQPDFCAIFDAKSTEQKNRYQHKQDKRDQFDRLQIAAAEGIPAFLLILWTVSQEAEIFFITEDSPWPFIVRRGEGRYRAAGGLYLEALISALRRDLI